MNDNNPALSAGSPPLSPEEEQQIRARFASERILDQPDAERVLAELSRLRTAQGETQENHDKLLLAWREQDDILQQIAAATGDTENICCEQDVLERVQTIIAELRTDRETAERALAETQQQLAETRRLADESTRGYLTLMRELRAQLTAKDAQLAEAKANHEAAFQAALCEWNRVLTAKDAGIEQLRGLLAVDCTCRCVETCDRCEAIEAAALAEAAPAEGK